MKRRGDFFVNGKCTIESGGIRKCTPTRMSKTALDFYAKLQFCIKCLKNTWVRAKMRLNCGRCTYEEVTEREIRSCKRVKNSETKGMDNSETEEA